MEIRNSCIEWNRLECTRKKTRIKNYFETLFSRDVEEYLIKRIIFNMVHGYNLNE